MFHYPAPAICPNRTWPTTSGSGAWITGGNSSTWRRATATAAVILEVAVLALEDPLHPKNAAGSPAAAPAPRIDCTNLRRVRRKLGWVSFTDHVPWGLQLCLMNFPFFCPVSEL